MSAALIASTARPLALAMRRDLVVRKQRWQGREYWIVKDPLALKYYRFEAEEFAILSLLDGRRSSDDIRTQFERDFAPQRISAKQLQHLASMLHRSQLVVADAAGQGAALAERARSKAQQQWFAAASNFLSLRFRGVDPDRFLTWLDRRAGWLFSGPAAALALLLFVSAAALVAAEFDLLAARLPAFEDFFAADNWLWLALALCVTKVLHELGHGLACKRMGGECHEMGVMLLVLTPCLYCNVSDAWMIPSKWRRAAVGAGGMYIELILASLATFGWWASAPGLFHALCLNVMFVSSVSTLLVNANPLMRFDGYYILADLVEIPNLRQKATTLVQRKLGRWLLGLTERPDPLLPTRRRGPIAAYGVASAVYGWLVSLSIFWFLYRVLEPYGLRPLGQLLGLAMIASLVVLPIVKLVRFVFQPAGPKELRPMRVALSFSIMAGIVAAALCAPLPYYVAAALTIEPRGAAHVYVEVPGELRATRLQAGEVAAGQMIAELEDVEARLAAQRLASQRAETEARIEGIRQRAHADEAALLELSQAEEALAALNNQLKRLEQDLAKLTVRAPVDGIFVPPPTRPQQPQDQATLATWSGRPLDVCNVGAFLPASTLLGRIQAPGKLEAILAIPQEELDFVAAGQAVDLQLASRPGERFGGRIDRISSEDVKVEPAESSSSRKRDSQRSQTVRSVTYQASVPVDDPEQKLVVGTTGLARIHAGYQPTWRRLWRMACHVFQFEM